MSLTWMSLSRAVVTCVLLFSPAGCAPGTQVRGQDGQSPARGSEDRGGTTWEASTGPNCPAPVSGTLRIAVLLLDRPDAPVACSVESVRAALFEQADSVGAFYRETSRSALELGGEVFGPFAIEGTDPGEAGDCSWQDKFHWAEEADLAAQAAGVAVDGYDRVVYVMAQQPGCKGGVASPPTGQAWIFGRCDMPVLYAHEIGHTLHLSHASTPEQEVGDRSDVMGGGRGMSYVQLNGLHRVQLAWAEGIDGAAGGTFRLEPLEGSGGQVLIIGDLYVSYRTRVGFDVALGDEFVEGASLHLVASCIDRPPPTTLVATLTDGQHWTEAGVTIQQVAHDAGGVIVEVNVETPVQPEMAGLQ